jgi:hypothetical protein
MGLQLVDTLEEERNVAEEALMAAHSSCWVVERGGGGEKKTSGQRDDQWMDGAVYQTRCWPFSMRGNSKEVLGRRIGSLVAGTAGIGVAPAWATFRVQLPVCRRAGYLTKFACSSGDSNSFPDLFPPICLVVLVEKHAH